MGLRTTGFFLRVLRVFNNYRLIIEWEIWAIRSRVVRISFLFDWIRLVFLSSVCLISGCIIKYSIYYIEGEINFLRFTFILFIFVVSMWILIISPNIIRLLLGWDGLGLTSYCLVIFYQNESSCNAGILTVLRNRIGDVAILLRVGLIFGHGSWDFYNLNYKEEFFLVFLVICARATKRAQMPFSAWLPAAIAAPTPVRALVHSSTLVTAGVYLLIRFRALIEQRGLGSILLVISVMTIIIAGLGAIFERDMKKVVALSTLRQLGVIIIILSIGIKELAFFHLITHAIFKSTLFMCTGFIIHRVGGSQDRRVIRGFRLRSPILGVMLRGTNLALCGFPFLAGFYSKDASLEFIFIRGTNSFICGLVIIGTGLTVAYRFRVLYLSRLSIRASSSVRGLRERNQVVIKRITLLFRATLIVGFLIYWRVISVRLPIFLRYTQKYFVVITSLLGGLLIFIYLLKNLLIKKHKFYENIVSLMWFMPFLSTKFINNFFLGGGYNRIKLIDRGWFEYYGGQGGQSKFISVRGIIQKSQSRVIVRGYIIRTLLSSALLFRIFYLDSSSRVLHWSCKGRFLLNKIGHMPVFGSKPSV